MATDSSYDKNIDYLLSKKDSFLFVASHNLESVAAARKRYVVYVRNGYDNCVTCTNISMNDKTLYFNVIITAAELNLVTCPLQDVQLWNHSTK